MKTRLFWLVALLFWCFAFLLATNRVSIKATPTSIICTVPRSPDNRRLAIGIEGYLTHWEQLDGMDTAVTHRIEMRETFPCLSDDTHLVAFCLLEWTPDHAERVQQYLPCLPPQ